MIKVHHLNDSRSQRILWLLEELAIEYEIVPYHRDPATRLAPKELKAVHSLGKSPVIADGDLVLAESGAIIDYLVRTYGKGRLAPPEASPSFVRYVHWLHFAEGSAMLPFLLEMYTRLLGDAAAPLSGRIHSEIKNHLGYMDAELDGNDFFVAPDFTAADIQMTFVVEVANRGGHLASYTHLKRYLDRMHARPAYGRAIARGGPYTL